MAESTFPPETTITSSRTVNYPQALVFRAWSEPDHLQRWWGPAGFTNSFHQFDFKIGGRWKFTMHGPDKGNYENECEFTSIEVPSKIAWKRWSKPLFRVLAIFDEVAPCKTTIRFHMLFDTETECNKLKGFVIDKNEENFDRLEKELQAMMKGM
jgi:uncharacterized protein YndB with AHSA1/START domain